MPRVSLTERVLAARAQREAAHRRRQLRTVSRRDGVHCRVRQYTVAQAAYMSELSFLCNQNMTTHTQSAEMHNQSVNSLAFIDARMTHNALQCLEMMCASYLWILCQALDLRVLNLMFLRDITKLVTDQAARQFQFGLAPEQTLNDDGNISLRFRRWQQ